MLRKLYKRKLEKYDIEGTSPEETDWPKVREFIKATIKNKKGL